MEKVFKVADIRDLEQKVALGEMSYSRMVEVLNEMAEEYYSKVKKLNEPAVIGMCEHPLDSLMFWNNGMVECKKCGLKTEKF